MEQNESNGTWLQCDRASHRYHVGETATFSVGGNPGKTIYLTLSSDGAKILRRFSVTSPATFSWTLNEPGFLRCSAHARKEPAVLLAVGFDPEQLRPAVPDPIDFDGFWERAFQELASIPADFQIVKKKPGIFLLSCATANRKRQYAFLSVPKGKGPFPLRISVGGGEAYFCTPQERPDKNAVLLLHLPPYEPADDPDAAKSRHQEYLKQKGLTRFIFADMNKTPRHLYLYSAILGGVRLIECTVARKDIDRERVLYTGASHGGAFGIFLTAFSPAIRAAFCGVPNFGDIGGVSIGRHPSDAKGKFKKIWRKLVYFDAAICAERIRVPVLMTVGFIDSACAPSAVYCIYNRLRGPKTMLDKVNEGHSGMPVHLAAMIDAWSNAFLFPPKQ